MEAPFLKPAAYLLPPITAVHPPDLETDDSSLATEILPAPPPLASVSGQRRDTHLKRPSQVFSYLPASDPGSTYSGLMGGPDLHLVPEDDGRLRKRPRVDKTAIHNRAQRASARNLTPSIPPVHLSPPNGTVVPESSTSSILNSDNNKPSRDKGKSKEFPPSRVKEESSVVSLDMPESSGLHPNDDHCSACRSHGALVYCDGCPRAFHLWCLDPPLDAQDVPEHRWYCPACVIRQNPPPKLRRSMLAPLLHLLQTSTPTEFELPEYIRGFFRDVATGPKGAYQDISETRITRSSRFIPQEEREAFRLKDKNGVPILCFRCGKSALPDNDPSSGPSSFSSAREARDNVRRSHRTGPSQVRWKSIVSCDHCALHWHLDCLDPPLSSMPPAHKKWMCPTHVDHIAPKRRVPRHVPTVTDVTERNRPNNGNIEIIPADSASDKAKKMTVDEMHINGRRYRVPERVIVLDFWDKLARGTKSLPSHGLLSGLSSPLTSLSSLDDIPSAFQAPQSDPSQASLGHSATPEPDGEALRAVELLLGCRTALVHGRADHMDVDTMSREKSDVAVQTEPDVCVKLEANDARQPSNLISPAPQDIDNLGLTRPSRRVSRKIGETPKDAQKAPRKPAVAENSVLKKPLRPPADTGNIRVTRSKAAPTTAPPSASALQHSRKKTSPLVDDSEVSLEIPPRPPAPKSLSSHTERKEHKRPSGTTIRHSTRDSNTSVDGTKRAESPIRVLKAESSGATAVSSSTPNVTRSPFKIRIPSAINTAVAAATAAAAASGSTTLVPAQPAQEHSRRRHKESDLAPSSDEDVSSSGDYVETLGITLSNGRRRSTIATGAPFQQASIGSPASSSRVTRSSSTRTLGSRASHEMNIFDRSPQYTDITSDSSSDFIPPHLTPKRMGGRGSRIVSLPNRGLG